jgi:hypothetical protein
LTSQKIILQPKRSKDDVDQAIRSVVLMMRSLPDHVGWMVEITKPRKEASNQQRKALWGCAYKFLHDETGNDQDDLHQMFCGEFFGWEEYTVLGQRKKKAIRTTTKDEEGHSDPISVDRFIEFYDFVQRHTAQTIGLVVPDPDPNWKTRMMEEADAKKKKV